MLVITGSTISHANKAYVRVSADTDVTDVVLQPGATLRQTLYVINEGKHSITFAPADKSNISGDTLSVVAAMTAQLYEWDGNLWIDNRAIEVYAHP